MARDTQHQNSAAVAFLAFLTLAILSAWPLIGHFSSRLPSDLGDPALNTWIMWWNAQATPLTSAWWNAPMFAPAPGMFSLSESFLALWPLTTPLIRAGASPVAAYNVAFVLAAPITALGAYLLAWRLTRRRSAALIAALAFGFSPYRIGQLPHLQMLWAGWIPLALCALHAYVETSRSRWLAAFGLCWILIGLSNGYFLIFVPVLLALWVIWFVRERRHLLAILATFVGSTLPLLPLLLAYRARQQSLGLSRGIGEINDFSADVTALWAASPKLWLSSWWTKAPAPEGELYAGLALFALCIAGAVALARSPTCRSVWATARMSTVRRALIVIAVLSAALSVAVAVSGGWDLQLGPLTWTAHKISRSNSIAFWCAIAAALSSAPVRVAWRRRSPLAFYLLGAAAMFLMALGPSAKSFGHTMLYKAPYSWLMLLPGGDSVRVPARFGQLMILCLAVAAALAWARLVAPGRRRLTAVVAVALLVEGWIVVPVAEVPSPLDVPALPPHTIVVELPMALDYPLQTRALLHAISHGRPIANGFSGYDPPHFWALRDGFIHGDDTVIEALRHTAPVAIFVAATADSFGPVVERLAASGGRVISTTPQGTWLQWSQTGAAPPPPTEPALSGINVTSATNSATVNDMLDGQLGTRWTSTEPQTAGMSFSISLGREARVSAIEMQLGMWHRHFPAALEITATDASGAARVVWRGSVRRPAVEGALRDQRVAPIVIQFDQPVLATSLTLTQTATAQSRPWAVAELKVLGQ